MLYLTRKVGQRIVIDGDITVEVMEIRSNNVKLAIVAPDCEVWRDEIYEEMLAEREQASDQRV